MAEVSQSPKNVPVMKVIIESLPGHIRFPDCFNYRTVLNTVKEMLNGKIT